MVLDPCVLSCRYTRRDAVIAVVLAFVVLIAALGSLYPSCGWGDDFAAYINEGIAIANGTFHELAKLNYIMHPSILPEGTGGELVYVWGYPLMLAVVYLLFGYDTVGFSSIIYYKLPSVLCFAAFAAVLYLFLRRRFPAWSSALLTAAYCGAPVFYDLINSVYSDVVYMFLCTLALLCTEVYFSRGIKKRLVPGILIGVLLWYTYEVRLNGLALLGVFLLCHIVTLIRSKDFSKADIVIHLAPYLSFFVLKLVSERLLLLPPTLNSGDVSGFDISTTLSNVLYYIINLADTVRASVYCAIFAFVPKSVLTWLPQSVYNFVFDVSSVLSWLTLALTAVGLISDGIKRNLQLSVYFVGSAIGTCLLPYTQGLRYLFGIMPVMLMFAGYGCRAVYAFILSRLRCRANAKHSRRLTYPVRAVLTAMLCVAFFSQTAMLDVQNLRTLRAADGDIHANMSGAYSPDAIAVYKYIQQNTADDDIIVFHKPRAMYLNTGRISFSYLYNDRSPLDADWCVLTEFFVDYYTNTETPDWFSSFEPVMTSGELTVMRKTQ